MINFNFLDVKRAIMHRILGKTNFQESSSCEYSEELLNMDNETESILKERLVSAFGKNSKSFELAMSDDSEGSAFSYFANMGRLSDEDFIDNSKAIGDLLAKSSNKAGIPGGFLLILDCEYNCVPLYILIKAEPHDALSVMHHQTQALRDIILSPTQKMYKAFCMFQNNQQIGKQDFTYYLFDNQFASGTDLARYFYEDFLGLTISENSKLLTKMFYERMTKTIKDFYSDNYEEKARAEKSLYSMMSDKTPTINPTSVINSIIQNADRDHFLNKICHGEFERSFTKDLSALEKTMSKRRIDVCDGLKIIGNATFIDSKVEIQDDPNRPGFKIITVDTNAR